MQYTIIRLAVLIFLSFLVSGLFAQDTYSLQAGSTFSIVGSSNIRDWEATADDISGSIILPESFLKKGLPKKGTAVEGVSISIPVADIDGGRGETMNGKIRKALKSDTHPNVKFELLTAEVVNVDDKSRKLVSISAKGNLTIGGESREISLSLKGQLQEDGMYHFFGSKPLKMTQFNVEPPSALFGQLQTKDDISVRFDLRIAQ